MHELALVSRCLDVISVQRVRPQIAHFPCEHEEHKSSPAPKGVSRVSRPWLKNTVTLLVGVQIGAHMSGRSFFHLVFAFVEGPHLPPQNSHAFLAASPSSTRSHLHSFCTTSLEAHSFASMPVFFHKYSPPLSPWHLHKCLQNTN